MSRVLTPISPSLDLVFKAIMGDPAHILVLLDFLNCVLAPDKIARVTLLNPTPFATLLEERNFTVEPPFSSLDVQSGKPLCGDLDIHVFELPKARKLHLEQQAEPGPIGGWIRFFTEAGRWEEVPKELKRPAMEVAMSTVEQFREDARANLLYMLREEENRVRRTQQVALQEAEDALAKAEALLAAEQARVATVQARAAAEQARAEAEQARAEAEHHGRMEAEARAAVLAAELRALKARLGEN